jgi:hypothetical protein
MLAIQLFVVPAWINFALFATAAAAAALRGDWRARAIGGFAFLQYLISSYVCPILSRGLVARCPQDVWRSLLIDAIMLAICLCAARSAKRYWVIIASSMALLSVATDITALLVPTVSLWAFMSASNIWAYVLALATLAGALTEPKHHPRAQPAPKEADQRRTPN